MMKTQPDIATPCQRKLLNALKAGHTIQGQLTIVSESGKAIGLGRIACSLDDSTVSISTICSMKFRGLIQCRDVIKRTKYGYSGYRDYRLTAKGRKA